MILISGGEPELELAMLWLGNVFISTLFIPQKPNLNQILSHVLVLIRRNYSATLEYNAKGKWYRY